MRNGDISTRILSIVTPRTWYQLLFSTERVNQKCVLYFHERINFLIDTYIIYTTYIVYIMCVYIIHYLCTFNKTGSDRRDQSSTNPYWRVTGESVKVNRKRKIIRERSNNVKENNGPQRRKLSHFKVLTRLFFRIGKNEEFITFMT